MRRDPLHLLPLSLIALIGFLICMALLVWMNT